MSTTIAENAGSPPIYPGRNEAETLEELADRVRNEAESLEAVGGGLPSREPMALKPPFLTPTSNDCAMDRGSVCSLSIEGVFDYHDSGRT